MVGIRSVDARPARARPRRSGRPAARSSRRSRSRPRCRRSSAGCGSASRSRSSARSSGSGPAPSSGLGVLVNLARGSLFDIPLMFATLADDRPARDRPLPRRRRRRAPPRRRPLSPALQEVLVSQPVPSFARRSSSRRRRACSSPACGPAGASSAAVRRRRSRPSAARARRDRRSSTRRHRARAGPALDRRPRLHPERPVRAVLPRRAGGLLQGRRSRRRRSRTRSDDDLVPLVGQGDDRRRHRRRDERHPGRQPGHPGQVRRDDLRPVPHRSCSRRRRPGSRRAADLKGKKIGIPGGTARRWIMLQALLASAGLTPDDVQIVEYPDFGQGAAVAQGAVDAATGLRQQRAGPAGARAATPVVVLQVDDITPLPGTGLIAGDDDARREARRDRRRSSRRRSRRWTRSRRTRSRARRRDHGGARARVSDRTTQKAILDATIDSWTGRVADGPRPRRDRQRRLGQVRRVPPVARSREIAGDRGWPRPERSPARGRVRARVWFPEERISDERLVVGRPERRRSHSRRRSALVHPDLVPSGTMGPESRRSEPAAGIPGIG